MPSVREWFFRALGLLVALVCFATVALIPMPAGAAATSTGSTGGHGVSLHFTELGLQSSYSFATSGTTNDIQLPTPQGLTPSSVTGTLIIPTDFGTGTLVVLNQGNFVSSFPLPRSSAQQQTVPFSVSLVGPAVTRTTITYTLSIQQAGGGVPNTYQNGTCGTSGLLPLTITNLVANYGGSFANPTTIANFFPPVMDTLTLYVPQNPTQAEQQTVLTAATSIVAAYNLVPVQVSVQTWNGDGIPSSPRDPLSRSVLIEQSSLTGISLPTSASGNRVLVVTGTSTSLAKQATLLSSSVYAVVQATKAQVITPFAPPTVNVGGQTFSQLGISGATTFSGDQQISVPLSESQLGGIAKSIHANLQATYSPLEPGAKGSISISVGGVVLATHALDTTGTLNLPVTIPPALISRITTLVLSMTYFPVGFTCSGATRTMTFTIDPRSTVTPTLATTGVGGFPAQPQAFIPTFQVSFDQATVERLASAVSAVCGLQRISAVILDPQVVPLSTSKDNSLPLLVVAPAQAIANDFHAPLQYRNGSVFAVTSGSGGGTIKMDAPLGAMEAFADTTHNRTVLEVTTTGSWSLIGNLFTWLGYTPTKWQALTGDVLATGPQGPPVDLTVVSGGNTLFSSSGNQSKDLYLIGLALFLFVLLVLMVWAIIRYRRPNAPPS